jgi:hypothetical protein
VARVSSRRAIARCTTASRSSGVDVGAWPSTCGSQSKGRGLLAPAGDQDFGRRLGVELRGPTAIGGELQTARPLTTGELATELGLAVRDELYSKRLHFVATRRPGLDEHFWHALDLGDAVLVDRHPRDLERGGELGPKRRAIQHAGGLLVLVELATIEA